MGVPPGWKQGTPSVPMARYAKNVLVHDFDHAGFALPCIAVKQTPYDSVDKVARQSMDKTNRTKPGQNPDKADKDIVFLYNIISI